MASMMKAMTYKNVCESAIPSDGLSKIALPYHHYHDLFGDRCYLLTELHGSSDDKHHLDAHIRLAKETGVARGTIYRHWPTIDDLIVEIFESCDPTPYAAQRIGELRVDLIAELSLLSENLASSKLGDIILNAARLADNNALMARVHVAMHDIILQPILAILSDHGLRAEREAVGRSLVAPILYHHLFEAGQTQIDVEPIVDLFLLKPD